MKRYDNCPWQVPHKYDQVDPVDRDDNERINTLLEAFEKAVGRMEAVAAKLPVENRAPGVSQATHVSHIAGHLAQHAKFARLAIAKAKGEA
jgi:hypothetical protein